jgi:hypothetical protein
MYREKRGESSKINFGSNDTNCILLAQIKKNNGRIIYENAGRC